MSFFAHRDRPLALMHCVAEYPISRWISCGSARLTCFAGAIPISPSGFRPTNHRTPSSRSSSPWQRGAAIFEKHVGVATSRYALNDKRRRRSRSAWGGGRRRGLGDVRQLREPRSRQRTRGRQPPRPPPRRLPREPSYEAITVCRRHKVFFAMPVQEGQLYSQRLSRNTPKSSPTSAIRIKGALTAQPIPASSTIAIRSTISPGRSRNC